MSDSELRDLVADFCASRWMLLNTEPARASETVGVSREVERTIRNMSGLARRRESVSEKPVYYDPVPDLARACQ